MIQRNLTCGVHAPICSRKAMVLISGIGWCPNLGNQGLWHMQFVKGRSRPKSSWPSFKLPGNKANRCTTGFVIDKVVPLLSSLAQSTSNKARPTLSTCMASQGQHPQQPMQDSRVLAVKPGNPQNRVLSSWFHLKQP